MTKAPVNYSIRALVVHGARFTPYRFPKIAVVEVDNAVAGRNVLAIASPSMILMKRMAFTTKDVFNQVASVLPHEVAHQWWPMTVSNNETWYGWMDEGFNQYMNILSGADARGVPANLNGNGQSYGNMSGSETEAPMMWIANDAGTGYSYQTYSKTPLMLSMLGGVVPGGGVGAMPGMFFSSMPLCA